MLEDAEEKHDSGFAESLAPGAGPLRQLRLETWGRARPFVDWFLPTQPLEDEASHLRAELVITFNLIFIGLAALTWVVLAVVVDLPEESRSVATFVIPAFFAGVFASLTAMRFAGADRLAAHLTVASIYATMVLASLLQGGTHSSVLALWALIPIIGGLLSGRRASSTWGLLVVATFLTMFALQQSETVVWEIMPPATYRATVVINLTIACFGASAAVGAYETIHTNLRSTLASERAKFRYQAGHDELTELPNRRLFFEIQETALRRADRTKRKVGLFLIDLDDFKQVNDAFGHNAGDRMLQTVAMRLRRFLRVTDAVARLGGDEFAVLVELLDSHDDARTFAERLEQELSGEVEVGPNATARISASIGVAMYPDDGETVEELREEADAAMYAAKHAGGGRHRFAPPRG
jgi:diguanylate cyclase (GGDEF)-like protein